MADPHIGRPEPPLSRHIPERRFTRWDQFVALVASGELDYWAFGGQCDANWRLAPSLYRYAALAGVHASAYPVQEERIIRIFKRKAHLYLSPIPAETDDFQWLALMQHHGAPTRLLDFTWSPYVAAFFALERPGPSAAVWAVNTLELWDANRHLLEAADPRQTGRYAEFYRPNNRRFVWQGEPFIMNQRLIAQSGTFLVSGNLNESIGQLLLEMNGENLVTRIVFEHAPEIRREAMRALYTMNITHATLFPDLDGLARSLSFEFEYNWFLDTRTGEPVARTPPTGRL